MILTSTDGGRYVYKVTEQFIVSPSQYEVLAPSDSPILTLTSCHPRYSASKRIIVRAALDPAQSAPLHGGRAGDDPANDGRADDHDPAGTRRDATEPSQSTSAPRAADARRHCRRRSSAGPSWSGAGSTIRTPGRRWRCGVWRS